MARTKTGIYSLAAMSVAIVSLVWAGMIVGVSGLATPAKFVAPSLNLPIALEVGRVTFQVFSKVEWVFAFFLGLSITSVGWRFPAFCWTVLAVVVVLLILQAVWLLPALDARVSAVIAGVPQQTSIAHVLYVAAESIKIVGLLVIGGTAIRAS